MRHGFIWYRFAHETEESFKKLSFGSESLNVPDLKILIAQVTGLEKEFTRAFDLKLSLVVADQEKGEPGKNLEELNDAQVVPSESHVVVQRVAWTQRPVIQHEARTELPSSAWNEPTATVAPKEKLPLHQEFVCPLCHQVLNHPVVARCSGRCRKSACRQCIEDRIKDDRMCPFCSGRVQNVIPNKALAAIISQLNLEDYDIPEAPGSGTKADVKAEESTHDALHQREPPASVALPPRPQDTVTVVKTELHDASGTLEQPVTSASQHPVAQQTGQPQTASVAALLANPLLKSLGAALAKKQPPSSSKSATSAIAHEDRVPSDTGLIAGSPYANASLLASQSSPEPGMSSALPIQRDVLAPQVSEAEGVQPPKVTAKSGALHLLHALSHKRAQERQAAALKAAPTPAIKREEPQPFTNRAVLQGASVDQAQTLALSPEANPSSAVPAQRPLVPGDDMGPPSLKPSEVIERHKRARQYEFDELTNSWRSVARNAHVDSATTPAVKKAREQGRESAVGANADLRQRCPFTIDDLASRFPFLSRENFLLVREFQQRVKARLEATRSS